MSRATKFIRLDLLSIQPYIKNLIFSLVFILFFGIFMKNGAFLNMYLCVIAATLLSYPFSLEEKNGLNKLYGTLAVKKSDIVAARYLMAVLFGVLLMVIGGLMNYGVTMAFSEDEGMVGVLVGTGVSLVLYAILLSFQLPLYFAMGYTKAKLLGYLPLILFALAIPASTFLAQLPEDHALRKFFDNAMSVVENQPWMLLLECVLASAILLLLSYCIAKPLYLRRMVKL